MARIKAAYQRIDALAQTLEGYQDVAEMADHPVTEMDLAFNQIEATLAVAQATAELAHEVSGVRDQIRALL